jgi:hypothetical protein
MPHRLKLYLIQVANQFLCHPIQILYFWHVDYLFGLLNTIRLTPLYVKHLL